jgi:hypothetical protein
MQHRFYDIKIECENGAEMALDQEYILEVPEHDLSLPVDRMEYLGAMLDTVTAASGQPVISFRSNPVGV